MIVIPPIDCTAPGVLIATNATDAAAWSAIMTYALDAQISHAGRNWLSVQAGNIGHTPGTDPLWWLDDGPVNSLAMFDTSVQTATTRTGGLSWTLAVGRFTAIGLMGLIGKSVAITIQEGATLIGTETRSLLSSEGTYYSFCFDAPYQTDATTFSGLPSSPACTVTISIDAAPAAEAACGLCVIGKQFFAGEAKYGFASPIEDRGRHYLDISDNPVNLERGYSKNISGTLVSERLAYNRLMSFLAAHIGVPMLWVATPGISDFVGANVFGRYIRSNVVIENRSQVTTNLEISGYR
ncbi:hypothetical protein LHU53_15550 [Rhodoferax sp. U2-2l]|uniref:hypothetical protein n=1 Tax=Rhodoferax sp. U2-2l TaxID=2884000 RepID=UPI001D0A97B7|nr:hypothetical protein [Rhodoferax sp. U2-2l]MCB8748315.1 hypothetical protein [Rhodoferax sp. U2-2l]